MVLDNQCSQCVLGENACPVYLVQSVYNYDACNDKVASEILNYLIRQDKKTFEYLGCAMFELLDKKGIKLAETPLFDLKH
jgi:hypothetical protein